VHDVGAQHAQARGEPGDVGECLRDARGRGAPEADRVAARVASGGGDRHHLHRDAELRQPLGERALLAEDHVRVHAAQAWEQAHQRDLTARQARDVIEVHHPQALVALAREQLPVERAVALGDRRPGEPLAVAARGRARRQLSL
jgi:hypothetical protein